MLVLIALCRSGYEAVLAEELTHSLGAINVAGYGVFDKGQGWLRFHLPSLDAQSAMISDVERALGTLIFARQVWWQITALEFANKQDRVGSVLDALKETHTTTLFNQVMVEYPDTESGKEVAKFARKFTVPLRQALRSAELVRRKPQQKLQHGSANLHVLMLDFEHAVLGYSITNVTHSEIGGIVRLKLPSSAPSRSTLKLEDAILHMLDEDERQRLFYPGANAVDLGACPGGWTYQLVKRDMHVEAVDNGDIAPSLMATGLVEHHAVDGFTYKPAYGHVTLLVCDMIEQPDRVAKLMAEWLVNGYADHAIFNLKLPMKQRFATVNRCLGMIELALKKIKHSRFSIRAKHLYHDRDEITVCAIKNPD